MCSRALLNQLSRSIKCLANYPAVNSIHRDIFVKRCYHRNHILLSNSGVLDLSNPALETHLRNTIENIESSSLHPNQRAMLIYLWATRKSLLNDVIQLENEISKDPNEEMKLLAKEEGLELQQKISDIDVQIVDLILPSPAMTSNVNSMIFEVTAGVGGQEAMLFAAEMIAMYEGFIEFNGWQKDVTEVDKSDIGGLRHGSIGISGIGAFEALSLEAGVHRVQRVPKTEKTGRTHTSTVTVAVLPQPTDVQIEISPKELKIETKRASGAGGQHVNTTDSCVRIVHLPSGIAIECQSERSQIQNRAKAMQRLRAKLFQMEINKQESETRSSRKKQVGSSFRSEKIRTFNFPQDRITDHRIGKSLHNIKEFMLGGEQLTELNQELLERKRNEELQAFLASIS